MEKVVFDYLITFLICKGGASGFGVKLFRGLL